MILTGILAPCLLRLCFCLVPAENKKAGGQKILEILLYNCKAFSVNGRFDFIALLGEHKKYLYSPNNRILKRVELATIRLMV